MKIENTQTARQYTHLLVYVIKKLLSRECEMLSLDVCTEINVLVSVFEVHNSL